MNKNQQTMNLPRERGTTMLTFLAGKGIGKRMQLTIRNDILGHPPANKTNVEASTRGSHRLSPPIHAAKGQASRGVKPEVPDASSQLYTMKINAHVSNCLWSMSIAPRGE
ncbi:hypothetical protein AcW1_008805 [Taiwanofungus camphoratus]|nr:hypothetical protein AcW1_008805 [Antrodia cinnamomea]